MCVKCLCAAFIACMQHVCITDAKASTHIAYNVLLSEPYMCSMHAVHIDFCKTVKVGHILTQMRST